MTQHTPGPWTVTIHPTKYPDLHEYSVHAPRGWQEADGSYSSCSVVHGLDSAADARLIAAAPELLAALNAIFEHCALTHKHWGEDYNAKQADEAQAMARAAIAKAEGTKP